MLLCCKRKNGRMQNTVLDEETKEITEDIEGVFKQFPLKLAWAITIHKSQGLTFERAIIDASASFLHTDRLMWH